MGLESKIARMPLVSDLGFIKGTAPAVLIRVSGASYRDHFKTLTFSPATGGNPAQARMEQNGVLIEDASTNLASNAEIGNPSFPWVLSTGTDSQPDPSNGNNAFLSLGDLAGFSASIDAASLLPSTQYDISVFIKESTVGNHFDFGIASSLINLDDGVRGQWVGGIPVLDFFYGSGSNYRVEPYVLGYFRITVTIITNPSGNLNPLIAGRDNLELGGTFFYGFDVQLAHSSFIRSQGATKTRAAETLTIPTANIPSDADFTISLNADTRNAIGGDRHVIGIAHAGSTGIKFNSAGQVVFTYNGVSGAPVNVGLGVNARLTMVYDKVAATINGYVDAINVVADLAVMPQAAAITAIYLGADSAGNNQLNGHAQELDTYADPLTAIEVANELENPMRPSLAITQLTVLAGVLRVDGFAVALPNTLYLSPDGGPIEIANNGPIGNVATTGSDLIVNGTTITSPAALFISPDGVLTDIPNGSPVANFLIN